jgi:hypothetical protein
MMPSRQYHHPHHHDRNKNKSRFNVEDEGKGGRSANSLVIISAIAAEDVVAVTVPPLNKQNICVSPFN